MSEKGRVFDCHGCIQVAGVLDAEEARILTACGVDYIGVPFGVPVHKELTAEADVTAIVRAAASTTCVLITYLENADAIRDGCDRLGIDTVQLHGDIEPGEVEALGEHAFVVVKSLIIDDRNPRDFRGEIDAFAPFVDAFITDTYDPDTGATGATGKVHDWQASRQIVEWSPRPVILAGGLTPDNVGEAIAAVGPAGVDVHTGVENEAGRKTEALVRGFVLEAKHAFSRRR